MYALLSGFLLGILLSIFRKEPGWNTQFLLPAPPIYLNVASLSKSTVRMPDICSSPEVCPSILRNLSSTYHRKSTTYNRTHYALVVYNKKEDKSDGLTLSAVAWAVLRVGALATAAVTARIVVGAAVKHIAFKKIMRPLWATLEEWQGTDFHSRFVTTGDYSQMDALLTSHLDILDAFQLDIQSLLHLVVTSRRLARVSAQHRLATAATAEASGSRVWWRALHLLVRELRLSVHTLRLRLERRAAAASVAAAAMGSPAASGGGAPASVPRQRSGSPSPPSRRRRHVGRPRPWPLVRGRPRSYADVAALARAPRPARVQPRAEGVEYVPLSLTDCEAQVGLATNQSPECTKKGSCTMAEAPAKGADCPSREMSLSTTEADSEHAEAGPPREVAKDLLTATMGQKNFAKAGSCSDATESLSHNAVCQVGHSPERKIFSTAEMLADIELTCDRSFQGLRKSSSCKTNVMVDHEKCCLRKEMKNTTYDEVLKELVKNAELETKSATSITSLSEGELGGGCVPQKDEFESILESSQLRWDILEASPCDAYNDRDVGLETTPKKRYPSRFKMVESIELAQKISKSIKLIKKNKVKTLVDNAIPHISEDSMVLDSPTIRARSSIDVKEMEVYATQEKETASTRIIDKTDSAEVTEETASTKMETVTSVKIECDSVSALMEEEEDMKYMSNQTKSSEIKENVLQDDLPENINLAKILTKGKHIRIAERKTSSLRVPEIDSSSFVKEQVEAENMNETDRHRVPLLEIFPEVEREQEIRS